MAREIGLDVNINLEKKDQEVVVEIGLLRRELKGILLEYRSYKNPDSFVTRWINALIRVLKEVADEEQKNKIINNSRISFDDIELSVKSITMILDWKEFPKGLTSQGIGDKDFKLIQMALNRTVSKLLYKDDSDNEVLDN